MATSVAGCAPKLKPASGLRGEHPVLRAEWDPGGGLPRVLLSYHPSRQNTNTGRLTEAAFDAVFARARKICC